MATKKQLKGKSQKKVKCVTPADDPKGFTDDVVKKAEKRPKKKVVRAKTKKKAIEPKSNGSDKEAKAAQVVNHFRDTEPSLFHDHLGDPQVRVEIDGYFEIIPIRSQRFKNLLKYQYYKKSNDIPSTEVINSAIDILSAQACFEGNEYKLHNRVAWLDDSIYVDLTNAEHQVVVISKNGWSVSNNPPILFRRYQHQKEQVLPKEGGDIHDVLEFFNLKKGQHLLCLVQLMSWLVPDIAHACRCIYGKQGSAKSTEARIHRRLADPSRTELLSFPSDVNNLLQQLNHHWLAVYDNLASLSQAKSDILCRAITGEGQEKRKLYTDSDSYILEYKRCIILTSINLPVEKPDLLDRSILVETDRIPKVRRREEQKILAEFEEKKPYILGAMFDVLSKAMRIRPTIEAKNLPRMADFFLWGCAFAEAMGYSQQEFIDVYEENIGIQHTEAIEASPVASALVALLREQGYYNGLASELLYELEKLAEKEKIDTKHPLWPKSASILSRRLMEVATNLGETGITIQTKKTSRGVEYTIRQDIGYACTASTDSKTSSESGKSDEGTDEDSKTVPTSTTSDSEAKNEDNAGNEDTSDDFLPTSQ